MQQSRRILHTNKLHRTNIEHNTRTGTRPVTRTHWQTSTGTTVPVQHIIFWALVVRLIQGLVASPLAIRFPLLWGARYIDWLIGWLVGVCVYGCARWLIGRLVCVVGRCVYVCARALIHSAF